MDLFVSLKALTYLVIPYNLGDRKMIKKLKAIGVLSIAYFI